MTLVLGSVLSGYVAFAHFLIGQAAWIGIIAGRQQIGNRLRKCVPFGVGDNYGRRAHPLEIIVWIKRNHELFGELLTRLQLMTPGEPPRKQADADFAVIDLYRFRKSLPKMRKSEDCRGAATQRLDNRCRPQAVRFARTSTHSVPAHRHGNGAASVDVICRLPPLPAARLLVDLERKRD